MGNIKPEYGSTQLDKQIIDCRKEINGLIDCFVKRIFPLFGDQWNYYTQLTVKLHRLQLRKELDNSSMAAPAANNYSITAGYKI